MARLLLINGPNLNRLGTREPETYGRITLSDIEQQAAEAAAAHGHELRCIQSNAEHSLIDTVHQAADDQTALIIMNPAAFTHTSVALRDAVLASGLPLIEVHLSNVHAREDFRQRSYFSDIAVGVITGFGAHGYTLAVEAAHQHLQQL